MLEQIKMSMRIFHNVMDGDITKDIAASMKDMQRVGIAKDIATDSSEDPLIEKAAELYCKWQNDFEGKGDKYEKAYKNLRDSLSLCDDYIESEKANV